MVKNGVFLLLGFLLSGCNSLQAAGVFRGVSVESITRLYAKIGRVFSTNLRLYSGYSLDQQQAEETKKLLKKLEKVKPFKVHADGRPHIVFDSALSFGSTTCDVLSDAVEKAKIKETIFVGLDSAYLGGMAAKKVVGGQLVICNELLKTILNGKRYQRLPFNFDHALAVFYHELGHIYHQHGDLHEEMALSFSPIDCAYRKRLGEYQADEFVVQVGGEFLGEKLKEFLRHYEESRVKQLVRMLFSFDQDDRFASHPLPQDRVAHLTKVIKQLKTKK